MRWLVRLPQPRLLALQRCPVELSAVVRSRCREAWFLGRLQAGHRPRPTSDGDCLQAPGWALLQSTMARLVLRRQRWRWALLQ